MPFSDYSATPSANTTIGDDIYIGANMARDKVRPALQQLAADGRQLFDSFSEGTSPYVVTAQQAAADAQAALAVINSLGFAYYSSTAAGIAATTNGAFFGVVTGGRAIIYKNTAGSAVQQWEFATVANFTGVREKLSAARTYYVRTNGSDSNDGLSNTAGGAFLTIQKAINAAYALDCNGYNVTIQIADGTYTGGMQIFGKLVGAYDNGDQPLRIIGNETTPANVIINPTNADAIRLGDKASVLLAGVRLRTTSSGSGIVTANTSYLEIRNVDLGACATETILAMTGSIIRAAGPVIVTGGSNAFVHATKRSIVSFSDQTLTFALGGVGGAVVPFTVYLWGINDASIHLDSGTIVGKATGGITVHINGVLQVSSCTGVWTGGVEPSVLTGGKIIAEDKMQARAFFVRTDGNDTNSGFADTASQAFRTVQGAINRLARFPYDEAGYAQSSDPDAGWKINVAAGAFAEEVILRECRFFGVTIEGAGAANTGVISFTSKALNTVFNLRKMTLGGGGKVAISAYRGSEVAFEDIKFVASTAFALTETGARIIATGNYEIAGASTYCLLARMNSLIDVSGRTVTITGTPALGKFAFCEQVSVIRAQGSTFSGSATGTRYDVRTNGVIETNGGGATYLPGGTAGVAETGGQYV